jgi:AraC-like DNA-binding protein
VQSSCSVEVKFLSPPEELRRFFTSFYVADVEPAAGEVARDLLHPEWANLRFFSGSLPVAEGRDGTRVEGTTFTATGPSCEAVHFAVGPTRIWGVGLLPLGWAKFVQADAARFANVIADGNHHPAFASFRPLADKLFGPEPDPQAEHARIAEHFLARMDEPLADEARIVAVHEALIDPEINTVSALVAHAGGTPRTVERICRKAFGFTPKLLLRRQRFMRSLAHFMLDPKVRWSGAMDGHYHDQAQFVRDFRQFMGMTPRQYAALEKPVISAVMRERARIAGAAVQTLDGPRGGAVAG